MIEPISKHDPRVVARILSPIPLDAAVKIMKALVELQEERGAKFRFVNQDDHWLIYEESKEEPVPPPKP
jgi:hypothetical protein